MIYAPVHFVLLLALTGGPLVWSPGPRRWRRTDGPPGWPELIPLATPEPDPLEVEDWIGDQLDTLIDDEGQGLVLLPAGWERVREILHETRRQERLRPLRDARPLLDVLEAVGEAGEVVRREREAMMHEFAADPERETIVEWVRPLRAGGLGGKFVGGGRPAVCSDGELQRLLAYGLAASDGRRAELMGAGRWCAAEPVAATETASASPG